MDEPGFNYFENTQYRNGRKKIHTLFIKNDTNSNGDRISFKCNLDEPLRVSNLADVFLDSFVTYDLGTGSANTLPNKSFFLLRINEFDIKSKSNIQIFRGAILVPNEIRDGDTVATRVHKGRKMNYMTTINSGTYHTISGTLTDIAGHTFFPIFDPSPADASANYSHQITFTGASNFPTKGGFSVHFTNKVGRHMKLVVRFNTSVSSPGTHLGELSDDRSGPDIALVTVKSEDSLDQTLDNAVAAMNDVLPESINPKTSKNSGENGLLFGNLHGGCIISPIPSADNRGNASGLTSDDLGPVANSGSAAFTVGVDAPHFMAEFVIVEKD